MVTFRFTKEKAHRTRRERQGSQSRRCIINTIIKRYFENNLRNIWTGISTPPKEEPSDKLDMLLNPEQAKKQEEDKKMAMEDLRDGRQSIVTYKCLTQVNQGQNVLARTCLSCKLNKTCSVTFGSIMLKRGEIMYSQQVLKLTEL